MPSSGGQTCALRSEEHTSELQSHDNLVCRLLLDKKEITAAGPGNTVADGGAAATPPDQACGVWSTVSRAGAMRQGGLQGGSSGEVFFFLMLRAPRNPPPFPHPPPLG